MRARMLPPAAAPAVARPGATGTPPGPLGSAHVLAAPYQAFPTRDGWINIGGANQSNWERIARIVGLPGLITDARFATNSGRMAHHDELARLLGERLRTRDTGEWLRELDADGVPAGPIQSIEQMTRDPQTLAREMVVALDHPVAGRTHALGFIGLFTIGGLTGLFLASLGLDVHVHDTYFVVAHFHYIMVGGTIMAYLGGIHFWWPKISGRMYPEGLAKISGFIVFIGFNLTFFPQFVVGYLGMPRRYHAYPDEFQVLNVLSSAGATVLGVGYLLPMFYLVWSMRYGKRAEANPWRAVGLEWETTSPPPTFNFETTPVVDHEAYDYRREEKRVA